MRFHSSACLLSYHTLAITWSVCIHFTMTCIYLKTQWNVRFLLNGIGNNLGHNSSITSRTCLDRRGCYSGHTVVWLCYGENFTTAWKYIVKLCRLFVRTCKFSSGKTMGRNKKQTNPLRNILTVCAYWCYVLFNVIGCAARWCLQENLKIKLK